MKSHVNVALYTEKSPTQMIFITCKTVDNDRKTNKQKHRVRNHARLRARTSNHRTVTTAVTLQTSQQTQRLLVSLKGFLL